MKRTATQQEFIDKANLKHNFKYDYSSSIYIKGTFKIIIICNIHGKFLQTPTQHLCGDGCPKCGFLVNTLGLDDFIKKANLKHNNKYNYSLSNYINNKHKIRIICPIHGEFDQTAMHHLKGSGCKKCNHVTGWTKTEWVKICNSKSDFPIVYSIRCFNDSENFIKIGRTCQTLKARFRNKIMMPYSYEVIKEIKGSSDFIFDKEVELHRLYNQYQYTPNISFDGVGECFNISILSDLK